MVSNTGKSRERGIAICEQIALPGDANSIGMIFGGKILHIMDLTASIAARRQCGNKVVTIGVDGVRFYRSIKVGHVIISKAAVNRAFRTSFEVGVKVMAEDTYTGEEFHACSGYITFVAMGKNNKPSPVKDIPPVSEIEKRRWIDAENRRKSRIKNY